jgi:mannose/fructose/N-acetylgalactosamine-specific phosphotransferase system component IIC
MDMSSQLLLCRCRVAGRSIGLSVGSLVAGIILGAALNAWLRVDIVPLGVSAAGGLCMMCHCYGQSSCQICMLCKG